MSKFLAPAKWVRHQLRALPYDARAQIYRTITTLGAAAVTGGLITDGLLQVIVLVAGTVLAVSGNALAAANTPKFKGFR